MRIAILILAHKNEEQLIKLLERLSKNFEIYLHLDKKWQINEKKFVFNNNIKLTKRYDTNWGSYNQILSTLELFKSANSTYSYDYYFFISGQDVPIKSNQEIIEFATNNKEKSFVDFEQLPKKIWHMHEGGFARLYYYWGDNFKKHFIGKTLKKLLAVLRLIQKTFKIKRKLLPVEYYGGWNWVNLNNTAVDYLLKFCQDQPTYIKSFKYTHSADEIWLQTILLNSGINIVNNNLRYVDWSNGGEHPLTLTIENIETILASSDLFARKFDSNIDNNVINRLYEVTA